MFFKEDAMRFCDKCGKLIDENMQSCPACSAKINNEDIKVSEGKNQLNKVFIIISEVCFLLAVVFLFLYKALKLSVIQYILILLFVVFLLAGITFFILSFNRIKQ